MIRKAVIPAAGVGTRLLPATKSQPKEMLPVGRKPTIQYVVEEIHAAGIKEVLIITSQQKRAIEDHFDYDPSLVEWLQRSGKSLELINHLEMDVRLFYTRQSVPKGLADAIRMAKGFVGDEHFVVCLGDSIIYSDRPGSLLRRMMEVHEEKGAEATIAFETVEWEDIDEVAADVALSGVGTIVGDSSRLVMTIYVKDDWRKLYYHVPIVLMPEGEIKSLGDFLTELYDKYGDRFFDVLRAFQECTKVGYIPGLVGMRGEILQTILKIDYPRFMRMLEGEVQQEEKEEEAGVPEDYVSLVVEKVRELAAGAGDEDLKQFVQIAIATLVSEEKIPPELAEKEEFLQEVVRALEQEG